MVLYGPCLLCLSLFKSYKVHKRSWLGVQCCVNHEDVGAILFIEQAFPYGFLQEFNLRIHVRLGSSPS